MRKDSPSRIDSRSLPEPDANLRDASQTLFESERGDAESYVPDRRALLRPAQVVEGRVVEMLQRAPVLVSQFDRPARPRFR